MEELRQKASLPTRGAWIEIGMIELQSDGLPSRSPHGERGLKSSSSRRGPRTGSRSPHGERGLKSMTTTAAAPICESLPTRGAWIEIAYKDREGASAESLPTRGAWIEISFCNSRAPWRSPSLPTRGAWIEIFLPAADCQHRQRRSPHGERGLKSAWAAVSLSSTVVAPHTGSVD